MYTHRPQILQKHSVPYEQSHCPWKIECPSLASFAIFFFLLINPLISTASYSRSLHELFGLLEDTKTPK